jgi:hypothetical protein
MRRSTVTSLVLFATLAATAGTAYAQTTPPSADDRIRNALSAAPAEVAEHATVALADGTILKECSSDWVCIPDLPDVPGNSAMCLDANWREVIDAS